MQQPQITTKNTLQRPEFTGRCGGRIGREGRIPAARLRGSEGCVSVEAGLVC